MAKKDGSCCSALSTSKPRKCNHSRRDNEAQSDENNYGNNDLTSRGVSRRDNEAQPDENNYGNDDLMSKGVYDFHVSYIEKLEQQGKSIPASCHECLKYLLPQPRQDDSVTNGKAPSSSTVASSRRKRKAGEKSSSFFEDNLIDCTESSDSNVNRNENDINLLSDFELEAITSRISLERDCDCDIKENLNVKRVKCKGDKDCFIVMRKKCKHEVDKAKRKQPELQTPSKSYSNTKVTSKSSEELPKFQNYEIPESKRKPTGSKLKNSDEDFRRSAPPLNRKKSSHTCDCLKDDESCDDDDTYQQLCDCGTKKGGKGKKKKKKTGPSAKTEKKYYDEVKPENRNNTGNMSKYEYPSDKFVRVSERYTNAPKTDDSEKPRDTEKRKVHCTTLCNVFKKHDRTSETRPENAEELSKQSSSEIPSDFAFCTTVCSVEKSPINDRGLETEDETLPPIENYNRRNDKYEAIMKTREMVWGNNVPPELIIKNTSYAKRHEDCCSNKAGNEYIPRYNCPKYGNFLGGPSQKEFVNRANDYSSNKLQGKKDIYSDKNTRNALYTKTPVDKCNCVNGASAKKPLNKSSSTSLTALCEKYFGEPLDANKDAVNEKATQKPSKDDPLNLESVGGESENSIRILPDVSSQRIVADPRTEPENSDKRNNRRGCLKKRQDDVEMVNENPVVKERYTSDTANTINQEKETIMPQWYIIEKCDMCDSLIYIDPKSGEEKFGQNATEEGLAPTEGRFAPTEGRFVPTEGRFAPTEGRVNYTIQPNYQDPNQLNKSQSNKNIQTDRPKSPEGKEEIMDPVMIKTSSIRFDESSSKKQPVEMMGPRDFVGKNSGKNDSNTLQNDRSQEGICDCECGERYTVVSKCEIRPRDLVAQAQNEPESCSEVAKSLSSCCRLLTKCLTMISNTNKGLKNNDGRLNQKVMKESSEQSLNRVPSQNKSQETPLSNEMLSRELYEQNVDPDSYVGEKQKPLSPSEKKNRSLQDIQRLPRKISITVFCKDKLPKGEEKRQINVPSKDSNSKTELKNRQKSVEQKPSQDEAFCDCEDKCECTGLEGNEKSPESLEKRFCDELCRDCTKKPKQN